MQPIIETGDANQSYLHYLIRNEKQQKFQAAAYVQELPEALLQKLRALLNVSYPLEVTIVFDDMGFYERLACRRWCDEQDLDRLSEELSDWQERLDRRAKSFFGHKIRIARWSEFYNQKDFEKQLEHALCFSNWKRDKESTLIESTLEMHFDVFGIARIRKSLNIPIENVRNVVVQNLAHLAADHRLKSSAILQENAIGVWSSEGQPNAMWPVVLSNYDGQKYVPSLVL